MRGLITRREHRKRKRFWSSLSASCRRHSRKSVSEEKLRTRLGSGSSGLRSDARDCAEVCEPVSGESGKFCAEWRDDVSLYGLGGGRRSDFERFERGDFVETCDV